MTHSELTNATWRRILAVVGSALALVVLVPWAPDFATTSGNDDPNTILQHVFFGSGVLYGRDIFFTHGPWAFWYQRHYWPGTYAYFVAAHLATSAILVAALIWAVTETALSKPLQAILLVAGLALFTIDLDARLFVMTALLPLLFDEKRPWLTVSLAMLAAFAALNKISLLVGAVTSIFAIGAYEVVRLRRIPVSVIAFAAAYGLLFAAAGQDIRHAVDLTLAGLDMSAAYGETMGHFARDDDLGFRISATCIAFLILVIPFGLAVLGVEWRLRGPFGLLFALALALILFSAFKAAFVREDMSHVPHAFATLFPIVGLYAAARRKTIALIVGQSQGAVRMGTFATYVLVAIAATGAVVLAARDPGLYVHKLDKFRGNVTAAADAIGGGTELRKAHERRMAEIRRDWPVELSGPVAVVGPKQIVAVANGVDLRPLPTLNVYQAWSPSLAARLTGFFENDARPNHLLIEPPAYDGRPFWRAIRAHYRPTGVEIREGAFAGAERIAPRSWILVSEDRLRPDWNTPFSLPAVDDPTREIVVLQGTIEPTLLGRAVDLLYKRPYVNLELERSDGTVIRIRFGPIIASIGTTASPWPVHGESIFEPPPTSVVPRAVLRASPDWPLFYEPEVELTVRRLRLAEPN